MHTEERKSAIREGVVRRLKADGRYTGSKEPKHCKKCNQIFEPRNGSQKYCSSECKSMSPEQKRQKNTIAVSNRRKMLKKMAVDYLGGECELCGYNTCVEAMDFHHRDPSKKEFAISAKGHTISWERMKVELDKCALLCANCHREVHAGIRCVEVDTSITAGESNDPYPDLVKIIAR